MVDSSGLEGLNWAALRREAEDFCKEAPPNAFDLACQWYAEPTHEVRFFAVSVLGKLAARDARALQFLFEHCGEDPAWQVNEGLAMAFDDYCAGVGYEKAPAEMEKWLRASSPALRRAVSEGLRPWTASKRSYFAANPQAAIDLLGRLKDDQSRYVQESVGNALRDISRKHLDLVVSALERWVSEEPHSKSRRTVAKFALKNAVKEDPSLEGLYSKGGE